MKIEVEISEERISDLLCNAFEGGSNYWYIINRYDKPTSFHYEKDKEFKYLNYPLNKNGAVYISDLENDNQEDEWKLDLNSIKKGFKVMAQKYPHHFANFLSQDDDAETGDVFLQCCLFGDAIYG